MKQLNYTNLFNSIIADDIDNFSSLIKNNENLSFGRFPIISLCYLYSAKKIIKKFSSKLLSIKNFNVINEPVKIYYDFKIKAGRCLRLYAGKQNIISAIEMLAIMHKDKLVKKTFKKYKKNKEVFDNLKIIYSIYGQNIEIKNSVLKISKPLISNSEKKLYKIGLISSLLFLICISVLTFIINANTGLGISSSPFIIYTDAQFYKALNNKGNYELNSNLTIDKSINNINFNGKLNGNNYTLYIKNTSSNYLILNNSGIIENLNIVYLDVEKEISSSFSLLAQTNSGEINNVNITCSNLNLNCVKSKSKDIYISGFANTNSGTIDNCKININAEVDSINDGECYISGFVGINKGKLKNCIFDENSFIKTKEVDSAAFSITNELKGDINNCKNKADITQESNKNKWSPTIAGIVLTNYGNIYNSFNYANLKIISTNDEEEQEGNVFLGGICAMNYSEISKCLSKGELLVESKKIAVYCGGITAYSQNNVKEDKILTSPYILDCGVDCNINIITEYEKAYVFAGGITGYLESGKLFNCYSLATFTTKYDETKYFFGTGIGLAYYDVWFINIYFDFIPSNVYLLYQENIAIQIGALINNKTISTSVNLAIDGFNTLNSVELIKKQGVFWE